MCGISGFNRNNSAFDERLIDEMTDDLSHRGPNSSGKYVDDKFCFGHRRLSIIDLSDRGNQPMYSRNGRYLIVFNGEVYNYKELATELNYKPVTGTDTEIILEAYVKWGEDFVHKLNGMFAMAIYDKETSELKIWRDRFGIKPLYYYWDGQNFAFASEIKALYRLPVERQINKKSLGDFLFLEYIPSPNTIYKNFYKLAHGSVLTFKKNELSTKKYYSIRDKIKSDVPISEDEALEEFERLFHSSVQYRCQADVPVGTFLSGGLDSSAISAAIQANNQDLSCYHISFQDSEFNESGYAEDVASILDLSFFNTELGPNDLLNLRTKINGIYDEPFAVSSVYPSYKVCQIASSEVVVALSGDGGDELFMGYGHYNWMKRLRIMDALGGKSLRNSLSGVLEFMPQRYARTSELFNYENLNEDWPHIWSQEQYMFSEKQISKLLGEEYRNEEIRNSWRDICSRTTDDMQRLSIFDLEHYLPDDLMYKMDLASMANGLEVRLPFLDHRLVEFAINLPSSLKIKHGEQKYLLKKYLSKHLPPDLVYREKWGFGAPVRNWMQNELQDDLKQYLDPALIREEAIFDHNEVKDILDAFNSGKTYLNKKLWALLTFRLWKEKFHE